MQRGSFYEKRKEGVFTMQPLQPIQPQERIEIIDIFRGIAILGILLVNIAHFSYPDLYLHMTGKEHFLMKNWHKLDFLIGDFLSIFVRMKFMMLFSFLFGFGMIIMMENALAKEQRFVPKYLRRLFVLLVIGIIHGFFIWDGDILTQYALLGFILLLFRKCKPRTLVIFSIVFYLLFSLPFIQSSFQTMAPEQEQAMMQYQEEMAQRFNDEAKQALQAYGSGSFFEIVKQRVHDRIYYMAINGMLTMNPLLFFHASIPMFSLFLLGAAFAKKKIFHDPSKHLRLLKTLWLSGLLIGLPANIAILWDKEVFLLLGAPLLMLFYVTSIVFLFHYQWGKQLLMPFAAVGRTAFTNYLMQSVIGTLIFYNYGLGLYGKVQPFMAVLIALGIFIFQMIVSNIWLTHYRYGPFEWVWRALTYGKRPAFRLKSS